MWCLEHKCGPSLTAPCPLNSHNSWWGSDLQQNPRSCNRTCSICFGHDHLLVGFFNVFSPICYQYEQRPVAQSCAPNIAARLLADEEQKQPNIPPVTVQESSVPGAQTSPSPTVLRLYQMPHLPSDPWQSLCPPGHPGVDLLLHLSPSHNKSLCSSEQRGLTGGLAANSSGTLSDRVSCSVISQPKSWTG